MFLKPQGNTVYMESRFKFNIIFGNDATQVVEISPSERQDLPSLYIDLILIVA